MPSSYVRQAREVICIDCTEPFITTGHNARRCPPCGKRRDREHNRDYRAKNRDRLASIARARRDADPAAFRAAVKQRNEARGEAYVEYHREWRRVNRDRLRIQRQARQYGLSVDELVSLFAVQKNQCPVCDESISLDEKYDVDHCHSTGVVRGVLHPLCNRGMGLLRDDADNLERAARYLRSRSA